MKWYFLMLVFLYSALLSGCQDSTETVARDWYKTSDDAITQGLKSENVTRTDVLGIENIQGETLIFYHQGMSLGVASISKGNQGYSWYRSSVYTDFDANNQPYVSIISTVTTEDQQKFQIAYGVVYSNSVKQIGLYHGESLLESKMVDVTPNLYYFLISGSPIDPSSVAVKSVE